MASCCSGSTARAESSCGTCRSRKCGPRITRWKSTRSKCARAASPSSVRSSRREGPDESHSPADAWEARRDEPTSGGTVDDRSIDPRRAGRTEETRRKPEVPGPGVPRAGRLAPGAIVQDRGGPSLPRTGALRHRGGAGLDRRTRERPARTRERARAEGTGDRSARTGVRGGAAERPREGEPTRLARARTRETPRVASEARGGHRPSRLGHERSREGYSDSEDRDRVEAGADREAP